MPTLSATTCAQDLTAHACRDARRGLLFLLGWGLLAGCGSNTYEQRLQRTEALFRYYNLLDQHLQGTWSRSDLGISMRIPLGYAQLPAPPPPKTLDDGSVEVVPDTRPLLGIELPGLVDAWQLPDNQGRLFVCTNHQRLVARQDSPDAPDPADFFVDFEAALQQGLNFTLGPPESASGVVANAKTPDRIPQQGEFVIPKNVTSIAISAGPLEGIDPLAAQVYEYSEGQVQVVLVSIYLKATTQAPDRDLRFAVETLQVNPEPPQAPRAGGAPSGGPSSF